MAIINFIVEGRIDKAVAVKLVSLTGHQTGDCFGEAGFGYIQKKIGAFNRSAQGSHYLALVDLMDTRFPCPSEVVAQWLPNRNLGMMFRVVVREIESWLLADSESIAEFLQVRKSTIPIEVESLNDPKQTLINIARKSRKRDVRETLVPADGTTAREGILYNDEMTRFVRENWNAEKARINSRSLDKCIIRLNEFARK